jgi:hypothetical protein
MSLKYDYFQGPAGLLQQCDAAFIAGQGFVGVGGVDVESLSLGDRNGSNLGAGASTPGYYFTIYGPGNAQVTVWFQVTSETAPSVGGQLLQVNLTSGMTSAQVATAIAAALNAMPQGYFEAVTIGNAIQTTTTAPGAVNALTLGGSGWGTAAAAVVQAGVAPTGNYLAISNDLKTNAAAGFTCFTLNYTATGISSAILRGTNGSNAASPCPRHPVGGCGCHPNSYTNNSYKPATPGGGNNYTYAQRQPNNYILKSYLAGIIDALAQQNIYSYEVSANLNVSDAIDTTINLTFNFSP